MAIIAIFGCNRSEQISRYTVEKPPPIEKTAAVNPHAGMSPAQPAGEPTDRTLAAIVPVGQQGWFFKITGPKDTVAAQVEPFTTFLKSVRFGSDGKPAWTLPATWEERPGSEIRYATLVIPGEGKPLELSVTMLAKTAPTDEEYALININRWRGQLRLPPIATEQLAAETTQVKLEGATATIVNLLGTAGPNAMGRGPFQPETRNGN